MLDYIIASISVFLAIIALQALNCNWLYLYLWALKRKSHSPMFFVGAIAGSLAIPIFPFADLTSYWWVPIALDIPSFFLIPAFIRAIVDIRNSK